MPKPKTVAAGVASLGVLPLMSHDYASPANEEMMETQSVTVRRPLESTPTKLPVPQKRVKGDSQSEVSNAAVLDAINNLTAMMECFGGQLKQNTIMITKLSKGLEFNAKEIKDCKSASSNLGKEVSKMAKENAELKERVQELERYKRRWNLKLRGLKEKTEERTRDEVLEIMAKINPQWSTKLESMVDSVHCVGKKEMGHTRQVVIQFTMRHYRDEFWRLTKNSSVCKDLNISFAEHILPADREARALLWPQIKQAREAGHRAYFRGPYGFVDGK
ncbi:hypothetical protein QQF64_018273 [Cirrhinus molitorella]|uniref:Cytoplasmic dynein 2 heavy chain 1-like protein n=1 Tax=Cirrhinus molitorella TaxID=172907 RepID=A0ABR3LC61_9TELE